MSQKQGKKMVTSALESPSKVAEQAPSPQHGMSHLGHALGASHICYVGEVGADATGEAAMDPSWVLKKHTDGVIHPCNRSTGQHRAAQGRGTGQGHRAGAPGESWDRLKQASNLGPNTWPGFSWWCFVSSRVFCLSVLFLQGFVYLFETESSGAWAHAKLLRD